MYEKAPKMHPLTPPDPPKRIFWVGGMCVVAELRRGPPTILLALGQVLTLPWWWQSLEGVPLPFYLH